MSRNDDLAIVPTVLRLDVSEVSGGLNPETLRALDKLAHVITRSTCCDAIGECGHRCNLRAGHPGDIHEKTERWGDSYRFRLSGEAWKVR